MQSPKSAMTRFGAVFAVLIPLATAARGQPGARTDGLSDRTAYEAWFHSLSNQEQTGANYWAGQRSLRYPGLCYSSASGIDQKESMAGCEAAKLKLQPFDERRKSEPTYRLGWNSFADPTLESTTQSSPAPLPATNEAWYFASTTLEACTLVSDVFPKLGHEFPSTPEGIVAATGGGSVYQIDRPAYGPDGSDQHAPGPVIRLTDVLGRYPTLALVQGAASCRQALALMEEAGTSGSAEQRWTAQNAAKESQWQVVFWNERIVPCKPLSEFIPSATSLERALDILQESDPDAYLMKATRPDQWERIIRTQGHNLRLVQTKSYCRIWFSIMR